MPFMYNELLTSESGGVEWCGGTDDVLVGGVCTQVAASHV